MPPTKLQILVAAHHFLVGNRRSKVKSSLYHYTIHKIGARPNNFHIKYYVVQHVLHRNQSSYMGRRENFSAFCLMMLLVKLW